VGKRAKNFVLAAATTLASLLIGIWVAAYLTVPGIHVTSSGDPLVVWDPEIGMVPSRSAHTKRVYPAIKDRATLDFDIYTDDRGARVDKAGEMSPGRADVMTVGCSFSWGYALPNGETYSSRLGRDLGVHVANFAEASYGSVQALQMMRRNRDLAPKLVVYGNIAHHNERNVWSCAPSYYPFCFDVSHVAWDRQGAMRIAPPASNGVERLQRHLTGDFLNPVAWLGHGLDVIYGRVTYAMSMNAEPDQAKKDEALAFVLKEMERAAQEMNTTVLVVFIPTNYWEVSPALPRMIEKIGGRLRFLDLSERFTRMKKEGINPYIVGDGHPNAVAHGVIADEIAAFVRREKLL
jgi:hypothetical protein